MTSHTEKAINRRTALQTIGAGGFSAVGLSGIASGAQTDSVFRPPQYGLKGIIVTGYDVITPYNITVSGKPQLGPRTEDSQASVSGKTATGSVGSWSDSFLYSGDITEVSVPDGFSVTINRQKHTITVNPNGYTQSDPLIYSLSVSGSFTYSTSKIANLAEGGNTDDIAYEDPVIYNYTGDFQGLSVSNAFELETINRVPIHTDFNPKDPNQVEKFVNEITQVDLREPIAAQSFSALTSAQQSAYETATTSDISNVQLAVSEEIPTDHDPIRRTVFHHKVYSRIAGLKNSLKQIYTHHHYLEWFYNGRRVRNGRGHAWGTSPSNSPWRYTKKLDHFASTRRKLFVSFEQGQFKRPAILKKRRAKVESPYEQINGGIKGHYSVARKGR